MTCAVPDLEDLRFGYAPRGLTVSLGRDSVFWQSLLSEAGDWPEGTQIALELGGDGETWTTRWEATLDGARAVWAIPADQVDAVLAAGQRYVRLRLTQPEVGSITWASGTVVHP